ncbi:MAG: AmmeMemoRadiSam system protein A [Bacteroidales bacterium]
MKTTKPGSWQEAIPVRFGHLPMWWTTSAWRFIPDSMQEMRFNPFEQKALLDLAQTSIRESVRGRRMRLPSVSGLPAGLTQPLGAFVSVYVLGKLRGCIGTFDSDRALYRNVAEMAGKAAIGDPRFEAVRSEELPTLQVEISVIGPRIAVKGPADLVIGRDGIFMELGNRRGTLLPQVAQKERWTAEQFLRYCAQHKMGCAPEDWEQAALYRYEAFVVSDKG